MLSDGVAFMNKNGEILSEEEYQKLGFDSEISGTVPPGVRTGENMRFYEGDTRPDGYTLQGLMDARGNRLTDPFFVRHDLFAGGICYVVLAEGEHKNVLIDKTGSVVAVLPDDCTGASTRPGGVVSCRFGEPGSYYRQLYDVSGRRLNEAKFGHIGEFYQGLGLIVQDRKVGLIDTEGNIVIPPVFPYDEDTGYELYEKKTRHYYPHYMIEDAIVIPYNGKAAILTIARL